MMLLLDAFINRERFWTEGEGIEGDTSRNIEEAVAKEGLLLDAMPKDDEETTDEAVSKATGGSVVSGTGSNQLE